MKAIIAILCLVMLAGCTVVWDKPGATQQDYAKDSYDCERDVRMSGGVPGSLGAESFAEHCMEAHGWSKK